MEIEQQATTANEVKTYNVQVAGVPLRIKATHDQQTVKEILAIVEERFDKNITKSSRQNSAILACLRLAEELYLLKKQTKTELENLEKLAIDHVSQISIS